jgi:hypothetical protein
VGKTSGYELLFDETTAAEKKTETGYGCNNKVSWAIYYTARKDADCTATKTAAATGFLIIRRKCF